MLRFLLFQPQRLGIKQSSDDGNSPHQELCACQGNDLSSKYVLNTHRKWGEYIALYRYELTYTQMMKMKIMYTTIVATKSPLLHQIHQLHSIPAIVNKEPEWFT